MAAKSKIKASRGRIRLLTPIREVSGLVPVEIVPYGSKTVKISDPVKPILVKALPAARIKEPKLEKNKYVPGPVDAVVEEYLNQARQANIVHSPYSFGTMYYDLDGAKGPVCSCCANRNRESLEKKVALQRGQDISSIRVTTPEDGDNPREGQQPQQNDTPAAHQIHAYPQSIKRHTAATFPWTHYPIYPDYIDPWSYPNSLLCVYKEPRVSPFSRKLSAQGAYIRGRVVEANTKYNESMHKLQVHFEKNFSLPEGSFTEDDEDD
ncbi:hypothetical protein Btru_018022 [Bulinus truncatus]|nr:hypothetical protein Btru_018022 [Bulinus truncatus]